MGILKDFKNHITKSKNKNNTENSTENKPVELSAQKDLYETLVSKIGLTGKEADVLVHTLKNYRLAAESHTLRNSIEVLSKLAFSCPKNPDKIEDFIRANFKIEKGSSSPIIKITLAANENNLDLGYDRITKTSTLRITSTNHPTTLNHQIIVDTIDTAEKTKEESNGSFKISHTITGAETQVYEVDPATNKPYCTQLYGASCPKGMFGKEIPGLQDETLPNTQFVVEALSRGEHGAQYDELEKKGFNVYDLRSDGPHVLIYGSKESGKESGPVVFDLRDVCPDFLEKGGFTYNDVAAAIELASNPSPSSGK